MKRLFVIALTFALVSAGLAQTSISPKPASPAKKPVTAQKTATTTAKKPAATTAKKPATAAAAAPVTTLKDTKEKFSYALGMSLGLNFSRQHVDVDPNILAQGLKDVLAGNKHLLTDEEAQAAIGEMQNEVRDRQLALMKEASEKNKADGAAFLAANKANANVITLPSGMQYTVITAGTGPKPTAADTVKCNYRGTLINGTEFDSSAKHNGPATFPVSGVIKGWTEALQLMPVGSKWKLFIPSDLAYGDHGAGQDIPPGATLIFEVELLSIENKETTK